VAMRASDFCVPNAIDPWLDAFGETQV